MSTIVSPLTIDTPLNLNGKSGTTHVTASPSSADVTGQLMRISPEMAADVLKTRVPNRSVSKARVRAMIEDLRAGRWQTNGESIILDQDLRLLDGQHRLMACAESGIAITAFVVVGVDPAVMPSIDGGKPKVGADFLSMSGMTSNAQLLASVARWLYCYERQTMRAQTSDLRNDQLPSFVQSRPGLQVALPWGRAVRDLLSAAPAAMLYYLMSHRDPVLAKAYYDNLANGDGLSREAPAHIIREKLLRDKSPRNHPGIVRRAALVAMGWIAIRSEKSLPASVTWRGCEDSSVPFPAIV